MTGATLLPTSVVGSHGVPGWLHFALEGVADGRFGPTDLRELYDDAVGHFELGTEIARATCDGS